MRPNRAEVLELLRRIQASPLGNRLILAGSSLRAFPPDRIEDAIADVHAALLAVSADVTVAGPQAAGYAGMQQNLEQGLTVLQRLAGHAEEHA